MVKKSILLSVSVFFWLFIGVSDYGYACHRPGSTDGGRCGKVDGDGSNTFQVHLAGAFVFDTPAKDGVLVVDLNERRTIARSNTPVMMTRPTDVLRSTWDGVFETCPVLLGGLQVESIFVGRDDWQISINTGKIGFVFSHIDLTTSNGCPMGEVECPIDEVDTILQLNGDLPLNIVEFPPLPGASITIFLDRFDIRGSTVQGIHPRERCGLDTMTFRELTLDSPTLTICHEEDEKCP